MSRGRARIIVRLSDEEMRMAQAAADVAQVDLKHLARMGVLREVLDVRNKLIEQLKQEREAREAAAAQKESSDTVSGSKSQSISGTALDEQPQGSHDSGTGT